MASKRDLRTLPKFRDGSGYLYLEHTRIEQEDRGIRAWHPDGMLSLPVASLGALLLGPGCSITHEAVKAVSATSCSLLWVGEEGVRFYASGLGGTRSAAGVQAQAQRWADPVQHLAVVMAMYRMRFATPLPPDLTVEQLRGHEGVRVRDTYARLAKTYGVPWSRRSYRVGDWNSASPINQAISSGTACLYGLAHAAIVAMGYSPALGFIHTGHQLSFVYDVADLYKSEVVLPVAFKEAAAGPDQIGERVRRRLRDHMSSLRLLERVARDLHALLGTEAEGMEGPGQLWNSGRPEVRGGRNYGGDQQ